MKVIAALLLILALGLVYFSWENSTERIVVSFFGIQYSTVLGIGLSIAFVGGALFMFIISLFSEIKLRGNIRKLKKSNQKMQNELLALKNFSVNEQE